MPHRRWAGCALALGLLLASPAAADPPPVGVSVRQVVGGGLTARFLATMGDDSISVHLDAFEGRIVDPQEPLITRGMRALVCDHGCSLLTLELTSMVIGVDGSAHVLGSAPGFGAVDLTLRAVRALEDSASATSGFAACSSGTPSATAGTYDISENAEGDLHSASLTGTFGAYEIRPEESDTEHGTRGLTARDARVRITMRWKNGSCSSPVPTLP